MSNPAFDPATGKPVFEPTSGKPALDCWPWARYKLTPCYEVSSESCPMCTNNPRYITVLCTEPYASAPLPLLNVVSPAFLYHSMQVVELAIDAHFTVEHVGAGYGSLGWICIYEGEAGTCKLRAWTGYDGTGDMTEWEAPVKATVTALPAASGEAIEIHLKLYTDPSLHVIFVGIAQSGAQGAYEEVESCWNNLVALPLPKYSVIDEDAYFSEYGWARYSHDAWGEYTITPGDIYRNASCPGGGAIYTDTDLSAYVGDVVKLDDGICYTVEVNTDEVVSDGDVTVVATMPDCPSCCDPVLTCGDCCECESLKVTISSSNPLLSNLVGEHIVARSILSGPDDCEYLLTIGSTVIGFTRLADENCPIDVTPSNVYDTNSQVWSFGNETSSSTPDACFPVEIILTGWSAGYDPVEEAQLTITVECAD